MTDYYMGFIGTKESGNTKGTGKWSNRIRCLIVGESFIVGTESCRKSVLRAAARIGMSVTSRTMPGGGYEMKRINTCPPRKRGHPKKEPIL